MEVLAEIGEFFWLLACTVAFFVFVGLLASVKFGLLIKFAIPVFGFLIGLCMGIFLGLLFSETAAEIAAIPGGVIGAVISSALVKQS